MARYRLSRAHFLAGRHFLAGAVIDWDGPPSAHMLALDDSAREAVATFEPKQRAQGRPPKRERTKNRAGRAAALHSPTVALNGRPLWRGFVEVRPDAQGRPAPPPSYPEE